MSNTLRYLLLAAAIITAIWILRKIRKLKVKMEDAIKKLDGVKDARVNFMTQKLTLEADDDNYDNILQLAVKACKKVEPDCEIEI